MRPPRFFHHTIEKGFITLSPDETAHARQSKRMRAGDAVALFDGAGVDAAGVIERIDRKGVDVRVSKIAVKPRPIPQLTVATAIPKGSRQDVLVEKLTELGVAAIQPLFTDRSVAKASGHRLEKWRRTAIEAAKQSDQCWLPEIREFASLESIAGLAGKERIPLLALDSSPCGRCEHLHDLWKPDEWPTSLIAVVGPEGGWSEEEQQLLTAAGAKAITLGPNVLRIETAAIAVAAFVHAYQR